MGVWSQGCFFVIDDSPADTDLIEEFDDEAA
jgi:hypothetical protein